MAENGDFLSDEHFGSLDDVTALASGRHVIILASGRDIVLNKVNVPKTKKTKVQQMVPFALEDKVAEDIDDLHFGMGVRDEEGELLTAVASRDYMFFWHEKILESGLRVHEIVPETLSVPLFENSWSILVETDQVIVRKDHLYGFVVDRENFADLVALSINQIKEEDRPEKLVIFDFSNGSLDLDELETLPEIEIDFDESVHDLQAINILSRGITTPPPVNMLSGEFSQEQEYSKIWAPWRPFVAFLFMLVIIAIISGHIEKGSLEQRLSVLKNQISETGKTALNLKKKSRVKRIESKVKARLMKLNKLASKDDLLDYLYSVGPVLERNRADLISINFGEDKKSGKGMVLELVVETKRERDQQRLLKELSGISGMKVTNDKIKSNSGRKTEATYIIKRVSK